MADVHNQRRAELVSFKAKQERAAEKIGRRAARMPEGQRALDAAIHIETRAEFVEILLHGILGIKCRNPLIWEADSGLL